MKYVVIIGAVLLLLLGIAVLLAFASGAYGAELSRQAIGGMGVARHVGLA